MTSTGGLAQSGTRTFIVGTVSGIDTSALVEIAVQAKTEKADRIDINVEENDAKTVAYDELQSLASSLQSSLAGLQNPGTIFFDGTDSFTNRTGSILSSDGTNPAGVLDITIDSGAPIGTYDVEIIQKAEAHKVIGASVADKTADLGHAGAFDIGLAGGATANINITADMSLEEIADAINAESLNTNVSATVLKVSETEFQLVLAADEAALDIEITNVTGDDAMTLIGVSDGGGGFNTVLQAAQPAIIELDGVPISRNSNEFDDLIDGITFTVGNESPGTVYTLTVENDVSGLKDEITNLLDSYNAIKSFMNAQSVVSEDGTVSAESILFSDNLMNLLDSTMSSLIGSSAGSSSAIQSLRDLGITIAGDGSNQLLISDAAAFDEALLNNYSDVQGFFSTTYTSDDPTLGLLGNTSKLNVPDFALDITVDGSGDVTGVSVGGDATLFTFSGTSITGAEGSIYQGLRFSYAGGVDTTVNVSLSQGFANRLYNSLADFTDTSANGVLQGEKLRLGDESDRLIAEAARIREVAEEFRIREIEKYAAMEAALQANELLVQQIRAIFGLDQKDD